MTSSIASTNSAAICSFYRNPISRNLILSPFSISFPFFKSGCSEQEDGEWADLSRKPVVGWANGADLSRKPVVLPSANDDEESAKKYSDGDESERKGRDGETWVDWEDQILEDTVPLLVFVRMILHSRKQASLISFLNTQQGVQLLKYWPENLCQILMLEHIGYDPNFESSRCLFIVRMDGELVDFSYWIMCIGAKKFSCMA
ncbi:hypothetical protein Pfo_022012 [Paulownia fortunei]|nr:hypothetical protein Pfo_022012 [Paulownia fortunei]